MIVYDSAIDPRTTTYNIMQSSQDLNHNNINKNNENTNKTSIYI